MWSKGGTLKATLTQHQGPVFAIKWSPNGSYLATGGVDNIVLIWDAQTNEVKQELVMHKGVVGGEGEGQGRGGEGRGGEGSGGEEGGEERGGEGRGGEGREEGRGGRGGEGKGVGRGGEVKVLMTFMCLYA